MKATDLWEPYGLVLDEDGKWRRIKHHRNTLLVECDWTQLADTVLNMAERSAWQEYRQTLRDIPQAFENPEDVVFPVAPGGV